MARNVYLHRPPIVLRTAAQVKELRTQWIAAMSGADGRATTIVAFKFSRADGRSFYQPEQKPQFKHVIGECMSLWDVNHDMSKECGAGVNLASADWVLNNRNVRDAARRKDDPIKVWIVTCQVRHIAAIPFTNDGKFRTMFGMIKAEIKLGTLRRLLNDHKYVPAAIKKIIKYD